MKNKLKSTALKLFVLTLATASSYAMAKPMVASCMEECTLFCKFVGLC